MGFIAKLFGNKDNEQITAKEMVDIQGTEDSQLEQEPQTAQEPQVEQQPTNTASSTHDDTSTPEEYHEPTRSSDPVSVEEKKKVVFSTHQALIEIGEEMSGIPLLNHLAANTRTMGYKETLTKQDCEQILEQVENPLQATFKELQAFINPVKTILELKRKCGIISDHTCLAKELTRETFLKTEDFRCLTDEVELLNEFQKIMPEIYDEKDSDFNKLRMGFVDTNNLYKKISVDVQGLEEVYDKLVTEITNYSKVVNEAKVKYRLSVDWNGKKQPLMSMGRQLHIRREQFMVTEEAVNKEIGSLCEIYPALHNIFRGHCRFFINELEKKSQTYIYDDTMELKKNQLKNSYAEILAVKVKLEKFIMKIQSCEV